MDGHWKLQELEPSRELDTLVGFVRARHKRLFSLQVPGENPRHVDELPAPEATKFVTRDGEDPSAKLAILAQAGDTAADLDPRVLKKILGEVSIPREPHQKAVDGLTVRGIKLLEGRRLAVAQARDEPAWVRLSGCRQREACASPVSAASRRFPAPGSVVDPAGHCRPAQGNAAPRRFVTLREALCFPVTCDRPGALSYRGSR